MGRIERVRVGDLATVGCNVPDTGLANGSCGSVK